MDWYYIAAVAIVGGAITVYVLYKDWQLRRQDAGKQIRIESAIGNTVSALEKFDEMADAHYGEGSIPEHISSVRDDLERGYRLLTGDDE